MIQEGLTIQILNSCDAVRDPSVLDNTFADTLDDFFAFDPSSLQWKYLSDAVIGTPPSSRRDHRMTSIGEALYLFGGASSEGE